MTPRTVGLLVLPVAVAGLLWELDKARRAKATSSWVKVPCTVLSLETNLDTSPISDEESFAVTGRYSYQVNGAEFTSTKISNRHCEFLDKAEVAALTAGLPSSGPHFAYYNPSNPGEAVLVPGGDSASTKQIALMGFVLAASVVLIAGNF